MDDLISVIMPAYNAERTIKRAIESVLHQTYSNWELIIVDDGSVDKTPEILSQYKDKRIKILTQENRGLSGARNTGIDHAKGLYITFIDSDDWYEDDFLLQLYNSIYSRQTQLCVCGIISHEKGDTITLSTSYDDYYKTIFNNRAFLLKLETGIMNSVCNKIYELQLIKDNNLRFKKINIVEDLDFNLQYLENISEISFVPYCLYHYDNSSSVLTKRVSPDMFENYIHIHAWLFSKVPIDCFSIVSRFIYHQYMALSMRFLSKPFDKKMRMKEVQTILDSYLSNPLVRYSFEVYGAKSLGERVLKKLIELRLYKVLITYLYITERLC